MRKVFSYNVVSATKHLEELSKNFNQRQEDLNKKLQEAEQVYQEKLIAGQDEANKIKEQISKEAQQERDRILQQARKQNEDIIQQAEKAAQLLIQELDERIQKEAISKASELIRHSLPVGLQKEIHSQLFSNLVETGFKRLENLTFPDKLSEIKVISAFTLSEAERRAIREGLKQRLNIDINIKEEIDETLVAGIVVSAGSLILDGSLKYNIREAAKRHLSKT